MVSERVRPVKSQQVDPSCDAVLLLAAHFDSLSDTHKPCRGDLTSVKFV